MNVKEIITSTRNYTLHSHTQFCDGHASMAEMAAAALRDGMEHYAFTPHSPTGVASTCNMSYTDVPAYLAECDCLKREYDGRMRVWCGMEIDYIGLSLGPHCRYYQDLPLDLRIGSVHFLPTQRGEFMDCDGSPERFQRYLHERFRDDIRYVVEQYYSQVATMVALGGFDIIGHFDKIAANASSVWPDIEETEWYQTLIGHVIREIAASGVAVEINTKARARNGRFFPSERWWPQLIEAGVTFAVNSDAHDPYLITASRDEAFKLLDSKC